MNFLYPQFLFALFALAIPVIVHLFNFRRFKRVLFTNVRFLQEIKQDTKHRSKLKHLLVLACRLLALTFLVLAFAQPYLPATKGLARSAHNKVSIWVDNSFSMNARGKFGPLLDVARERARDIAQSYGPSDKFQLITNDFEGRHQRFVTRDEFLQWLDEVRPSSAVRTLPEIIRRQQEAFEASPSADNEKKEAFLLSDFQRSLVIDASLSSDSSIHYFTVPFTAQETANLFIDTCFLQNPYVQPGSTQELVVRVKNTGDETAENVPLKLNVNGGQKALSTVTVNAGSVAETRLPFTTGTTGFQQAAVSLTDYPVTFDDTFFFAFNVRPDVKVLCINGGDRSPYLDALYGNDPYFVYRAVSEGQIDYNAFSNQQLIVLNQVNGFATGLQQELLRYMQGGGRILIIPSTSMDASAYQQFANSISLPSLTGPAVGADKVSRLETGHPLLTGVFEGGKTQADNLDLPLIQKSYQQTLVASAGTQTILKAESGNPFLTLTPVGSGGCFVLSVPLDPAFSGFQQHALFVPVFLKAVFLGASEIGVGQITGIFSEFSAGDTVLSGDQVFHLENSACGFDAIADARKGNGNTMLSVQDQVKIAGNYTITAGKQPVNVVAFNYDRKESNLSCMSAEELEKLFTTSALEAPVLLDGDNAAIAHSLARLRDGVSLWKYCILLALIFLAAEVLLIRFFKN